MQDLEDPTQQQMDRKANGVVKRSDQLIAYLTIFIPLIATAYAFVLLTRNSDLAAPLLCACAGMYIGSMLGITVGFHRYFSHHSFTARPLLALLLGCLGSMAAQGPLIYWVAYHRKHHRFSDQAGLDPHSPFEHGGGSFEMLRGLLHAHVGWFFYPKDIDYQVYCPDLLKNRIALFITSTYYLWVAMGLLIPGAVMYFLSNLSVSHGLLGVLWGGLVRMFVVHHVTWSVNSFGHVVGYQNYKTRDHSKNNVVLAALTFGDGWHNNHHAYPASARHGFRWWEIDLAFLAVNMMKRIGLARDIKILSRQGNASLLVDGQTLVPPVE